MLLHAQGNGRETTGHQPGVEGTENTAVVHHGQLLDLVNHLRTAKNAAAQRVTVAIDVLGHAVDLQVRTMAQGADADGTSKGGVHAQQSACLVGNLCDSVQVTDAGGGVTWRFYMDQFRVRPDRRPDCLRVGGVQQSDLHAVLLW